MDDREFKRLLRELGAEFSAMDENADADAQAMLQRIQPVDPNPEVAAYQLLLINQELRARINFFSLVALIEIVESNAASAKADIRHAPTKRARAFVLTEWKQHRSAYSGNKSAFARDYVRRIKHELGVSVTEKTIREVWLADTPNAGKPAG